MPPTPTLAITRRVRSTPFSSRIEAYGVKAYTVYNHMLLPTQIVDVETDYWHLRSSAQIWDVACERQVELAGPDAARLAQMLTVRDLSGFEVGRCGYAPVCDDDGFLINDPVLLKVAADRFWFSISDSDVLLWAGGIARSLGLDVKVSEPDIWPLAIQGRGADDIVASVFGDAVRDIKFFRFAPFTFEGHEMLVARSGWSAQGGFEIYVNDAEAGGALYDLLVQAGETFDIRPGCPNLIERIEAGLFTYGTDVTRKHTALEAGLAKYCALDSDAASLGAIGLPALQAQAARGVEQQLVGVTFDGPPVWGVRDSWSVTDAGGRIGEVTSAVWSPRLETNVAMGMMRADRARIGVSVQIGAGDGVRSGTVCAMPFPGSSQR